MESTEPGQQVTLLEPPPSKNTIVNGRCAITESGGNCIVTISGIPIYMYKIGDRVARAMFVAQAMNAGFATGDELSQALEISRSTVFRYKRRYISEGAASLIKKPVHSKEQWSLSKDDDNSIRKWYEAGKSHRYMARRLDVSPATVGKAIIRLGLESDPPQARQQQLLGEALAPDSQDEPQRAASIQSGDEPGAEVSATPASDQAVPPVARWRDPFDRSEDRFLASQGKLNDAEPIFASGEELPHVGVLLALPLIVQSGLFVEAKRLYGDIGPAFYGLRTSLLVLVIMALLRIKRPENIKEYWPPGLGRVLGLDRAPEVKTLRRKLKRLTLGPSEALLEALARRRVAARDEAMGFLYVDGHVRVYSGKHRLPKAHVTRMRMSLPAAQEIWVNDAEGDPIFFVTQEAHPQLVSALPPVLAEARDYVGDDRRITVVFDRGGWSPKLFKKLSADALDVITYRKGKTEPIPEDNFEVYDAPGTDGKVTWLLHQRSVWVGSKRDGLWMRQVTRRQGDHQTHVLTTRHDLSITEVAHRMFARWRQENFLKYMRQEFALDALLEYGSEEEDQLRDMPNPAWREADKAWKKAKKKLGAAEADYGRLKRNGNEIPQELPGTLSELQRNVDEKRAIRDALKERVYVGDIEDDDRTVRLPARRKRLSDALKMLAYQIESDLVRAVTPHYSRALEEGRTLIAAAFHSAGALEVNDTELRVILAPQSSPHRTRSIAVLCRQLDETETCFPGTDLRLRYAIREGASVTNR